MAKTKSKKDNTLRNVGIGVAVLAVGYLGYEHFKAPSTNKPSGNGTGAPPSDAPAGTPSFSGYYLKLSSTGKYATSLSDTQLATLSGYLADVAAGRTTSSGSYAGNNSTLTAVQAQLNSWGTWSPTLGAAKPDGGSSTSSSSSGGSTVGDIVKVAVGLASLM